MCQLLINGDRKPSCRCGIHAHEHDLGCDVEILRSENTSAQKITIFRLGIVYSLRFSEILIIIRITAGTEQIGGFSQCTCPDNQCQCVERDPLPLDQPAECIVHFLGKVVADGDGLHFIRKSSTVGKTAFVIGGNQLRLIAGISDFGWMLVGDGFPFSCRMPLSAS